MLDECCGRWKIVSSEFLMGFVRLGLQLIRQNSEGLVYQSKLANS